MSKDTNKPMLPQPATGIQDLLALLVEYGGSIVSSNNLHPDLIAQARASNRMYVDENSLGYVWEPPFAGRFPTTENEVALFERCYPREIELPENFSFEDLWEKINTTDSSGPIQEPVPGATGVEINSPARLELGEAWMWCSDCMSKLYSFDGNMDRSRKCPHPKQCEADRRRLSARADEI